ncbi:MAG: lytic transglycosylase domain-containing protein [Croceibacterium sp.]
MSSMVRRPLSAVLLAGATLIALPAAAQEAQEWDNARANLVAREPGPMAQAVSRWEQLTANPNYSFGDYAAFVLAFPGFPDEDKLRGFAEKRLASEYANPAQLIAFFDRNPPLTNPAKAQYALALMAQRPTQAAALAREAWRGGSMSDAAFAALIAAYWATFTPADHDARMDALLWARDRAGAERQLAYVPPGKAGVYAARLAILQGSDGATSDYSANGDPGYLYNRSRELRAEGRRAEVVALLSARPPLTRLPLDPDAWLDEQLSVAKMGDAGSAVTIAGRLDEAFAAGADISQLSYGVRDDYTSLTWLGGTRALWELGDARTAAALFYRYGAAARTPQTRSKGFFWAGRAAAQGGDTANAQRYYEMAAQYADRFYGLLALERLGRTPSYGPVPVAQPTPEERARFLSAPLTAAVAEVARDAPWSTGIRFYRAMASQAKTLGEHLLVADYARQIGRRDLAVNLSDFAGEDGILSLTRIGYPTLVTPAGTNWTLVHAIARQESQFAQNAISHAGASGLMQLMPGTAREEAGKAGIAYMSASLVNDPSYNVQLGNNYIERMYARYGSYPLAIAAYNAGPGNVNKWLAANGDPRTGAIGWIDWIERIPISETRNYVQRVLENAVVYEALYPDKSPYLRGRSMSELLR